MPAVYQILLSDMDAVPLRENQTFIEMDVQSSGTLQFRRNDPRQPERDLWDLCFGCHCNFDEWNHRRQKSKVKSDIFLRDDFIGFFSGATVTGGPAACDCQAKSVAPSESAPSELHVRFLLQLITDDSRSLLQHMFHGAVLGDRFVAACVLAADPRINVNTYHLACPCCGPSAFSLLEEAAELDMTHMCRMLIESGKLNVESIREIYGGTKCVGRFKFLSLILREGLQNDAFCDFYVKEVIWWCIYRFEEKRLHDLLRSFHCFDLYDDVIARWSAYYAEKDGEREDSHRQLDVGGSIQPDYRQIYMMTRLELPLDSEDDNLVQADVHPVCDILGKARKGTRRARNDDDISVHRRAHKREQRTKKCQSSRVAQRSACRAYRQRSRVRSKLLVARQRPIFWPCDNVFEDCPCFWVRQDEWWYEPGYGLTHWMPINALGEDI